MRIPPTRSGRAELFTLTDDDVPVLGVGSIVIVRTPYGLAPLEVIEARSGVAYDDSNPPQAYGVPVVDAVVVGGTGRVLTWAADDLLSFTVDDVTELAEATT